MEYVTRSLATARGGRALAQGLDLSIAPGEVWVVLGPNGCGKSTLLLTLAGVLSPASGTIHMDGRDLSEWAPRERGRRVAWQGELPRTEFGFRVHERLEVVPRGTREVGEALERLDLLELASRRLYELSAGELQRVELGALWLRDAALWLLDEPTAHLDLKHQVSWLRQISEEARNGRALVVVLHDLTQAHAIASQVLLLHGGAECRSGSAAALLHPSELERLFGARVYEASGPEGVALVPDYHDIPPGRQT